MHSSLPLSTHPESGSGAMLMPSVARTEEESDNAGRSLRGPYITHQSTLIYLSLFFRCFMQY